MDETRLQQLSTLSLDLWSNRDKVELIAEVRRLREALASIALGIPYDYHSARKTATTALGGEERTQLATQAPAMRVALERILKAAKHGGEDRDPSAQRRICEAALSSDAGKDYVPRSGVKQPDQVVSLHHYIDLENKYLELYNWLLDHWDGGNGPFTQAEGLKIEALLFPYYTVPHAR